MMVYSGNVSRHHEIDLVKACGWGRMVSASHHRTPIEGLPYAWDNGAFSAFRKGLDFDLPRFAKQCSRLLQVQVPDFAVVPDIVGAGFRSLQFSLSHVDSMWWECPSYLAVQDGMTLQDVQPVLRFFDGIFVGGSCKTNTRGNRKDLPATQARSSGWKWETAPGWIRLAHEHGMKCHVGRVGSWHDIIHAYHLGADSIDSTSWAMHGTHSTVLMAAMTHFVGRPRRFEPRLQGYGRLGHDLICGHLWDDDPAELAICRLPPHHSSDHDWQPFYLNGSPPILARDRGPIDLWEELRVGRRD